jgi:hypothetical protein
LVTFLSSGIATSVDMLCSLFISTDYVVRFIVRDSSVGSDLLVP